MLPVTTTTINTNTTFPSEIFDSILSHLAERPFEEPLDTHQVKSLQTCSLVCKRFASISRQLLFKRVEVDLSSGSNHPPLHPLILMIEQTPILRETVRELLITVSHPQEGSSNDGNMDPTQLCFLQLRGVESLAITRARNSAGTTSLSISQTFLSTYTTQNTLRSLTLDGTLTSDMWPHVLGTTCLQYLSIRTGTIPRCDSTILNVCIKQLHLQMVSFMKGVASVLSLFTALEDLELDLVFVNGRGDEQCWIPSIELKSIKMITTPHKVSLYSLTLLDGMCCSTKRLSRQEQHERFQNLHTLVLSACDNWEWDAITSMLKMTHNIQQLNIIVTAVYENDGTSILRRIAPDILNENYPLTHLRLKISSKPHPTASTFTTMMSDIAVLVEHIAASSNILEHIDMTILICTSQCLDLNQWGGIAADLADSTKFPKLRSVSVRIVVQPRDNDTRTQILYQYNGEEDLEVCLTRIMRKLGKREGVEFCAKLMLEPTST